MGKRNSQKKNAAMLDSDDTESISSTSSTMTRLIANMVEFGTEEMEVDKDSMLDQWLDALYEKRGSTREKALTSIIEAFNSNLQHDFVEKKFATLLHQCLNSIKKGSAKEVALASHAIGLLALTTGPGEKAQEILEESFTPISEALRLRPETSKTSALLECLAVITFVGGEGPEQTEKSMNIMWQVAHPKLGTNVTTNRTLPAVITTVVSAWSFLLTTLNGRALNPKTWQQSISYFSTLLDKDDRLLRIAAGEALALIFEIGSLEKFCGEAKVSTDTPIEEGKDSRNLMHIHGLRHKVLNQVRVFANEASGKGTAAKKDLTTQRNTFRDILDFLENGDTPESSMKVGGDSLNTSSWVQLIQLDFLKHFLGGGFVKHMQENQFLHDVFDFMPKKKSRSGDRMTGKEKRMYKSPNSAQNKARTQTLNKQRMLSQDKNAGHFTVDYADA